MRTEQEVRREIYWKEREKNRINTLILNQDWSEGDLDYLENRKINLGFSIHWCKWFLNE